MFTSLRPLFISLLFYFSITPLLKSLPFRIRLLGHFTFVAPFTVSIFFFTSFSSFICSNIHLLNHIASLFFFLLLFIFLLRLFRRSLTLIPSLWTSPLVNSVSLSFVPFAFLSLSFNLITSPSSLTFPPLRYFLHHFVICIHCFLFWCLFLPRCFIH